MTQYCITSDISNECLILNLNDLQGLHSLPDLEFGLNIPIRLIPLGKLGEMRIALTNAINAQLEVDESKEKVTTFQDKAGKTFEIGRTFSVFKYEGKSIYLDLRNSAHFQTAALLDLYHLVVSCIKFNGVIYIFDRVMINRFSALEILASLKALAPLTEYGIFNILLEGKQKISSSPSLILEQLKKGLDHLLSLGLVSFNERQELYEVTGRGRMLK